MSNFEKFFFIILTPIIFPFCLGFLIACAVYRKCVDLFLRKKVGEKYGGLLDGGDAFCAIEDEYSKSVVNMLLMVDFQSREEDFYTAFKRYIKEKIFDDPDKLPKFAGVCKSAFGYAYLLKNEYSIDECVTKLNENVSDKSDLQKIYSKYANCPLPLNHTAFWELLIGKNPIEWKNGKQCYPVLCRFNHTMTDAVNLMNVFQTVLNDKTENFEADLTENLQKEVKPIFYNFRKFLNDLKAMIKLPAYLIYQHLFAKKDSHQLHGKKLNGQKFLTWKVEDAGMLDEIKNIKNEIPETTFMDVLITAISASYEDYFVTRGHDVPENFTFGYTVNPNRADVLANISGKQRIPVLINDYTAALLSTPIRWKSDSVIDKLKEITRRRKLLLETINIEANYCLVKIVPHYVPKFIYKFVKTRIDYTLVASNIPGCPHCTMCGGHLVEDMIGWTIHYNTIGMSLMLLTYGGRLQFGLAVDGALIDSFGEVEEILNGITKHVNKMHHELNRYNQETICIHL